MDRCTTCYGSKTILGLGQIEGKCYVCKGTGERQFTPEPTIDEYLAQPEEECSVNYKPMTKAPSVKSKTTKGAKRG